MGLSFLDKTFILRNCIQQIELVIDISEELGQIPRPLWHTVQNGSIHLPLPLCEDTVRRWQSANQEVGFHQTLTLPAP